MKVFKTFLLAIMLISLLGGIIPNDVKAESIDPTLSHLVWPFQSSSYASQGAWKLTQGSGVSTHMGGDYHAQDWADGTCGKAFKSPIVGKVIYSGIGGEVKYGEQVVVQSDINSNYAFRITHLASRSVKVGDQVNPNSTLGAIGTTGNSSGCHAHIVLYKNINSEYSPGVTAKTRLSQGHGLGFSGTSNFAARFLLDGTRSSRVVYITNDKRLFLKVGSLGRVLIAADVVKFDMDGDSIVYQLSNGSIWRKDDGSATYWIQDNVKMFKIDGNKVGYIDASNKLYTKVNKVGRVWIADNIVDFYIDEDSVVYKNFVAPLYNSVRRQDDGQASYLIAEYVFAFGIDGDKVGYVDLSQKFYTKINKSTSVWIADNVKEIDMSGDSQIYKLHDDKLWRKDDGQTAYWIQDGVGLFELEGDKVAYVDAAGKFYTKFNKDGRIWIQDNVKAIDLYGKNWAGYIDSTNNLYKKFGNDGRIWISDVISSFELSEV